MTRYEQWSGETWFLNSGHSQPHHTIHVIESVLVAEKPRAKGEKKPKRVPFGFAREIPKTKKKDKR